MRCNSRASQPSRISKARLAEFGIPYYVPCPRLKLCLEPAAAIIMQNMLLSLRGPGKLSSCKSATLKGYRLPSVPPWAKFVGEPILVQHAYHRHARSLDEATFKGQTRILKNPRPESFWLRCSTVGCEFRHNCARGNFMPNTPGDQFTAKFAPGISALPGGSVFVVSSGTLAASTELMGSLAVPHVNLPSRSIPSLPPKGVPRP